jgi:hypothetical protein
MKAAAVMPTSWHEKCSVLKLRKCAKKKCNYISFFIKFVITAALSYKIFAITSGSRYTSC